MVGESVALEREGSPRKKSSSRKKGSRARKQHGGSHLPSKCAVLKADSTQCESVFYDAWKDAFWSPLSNYGWWDNNKVREELQPRGDDLLEKIGDYISHCEQHGVNVEKYPGLRYWS